MRWTYSNNILTLGTIGDNYWCSSCGTYTRNTTFYIDEGTTIKDFTFTQTGFDDWIRVSINGKRVYSAPHGDYWEKKAKYPYCSIRCELSTSWTKHPNLQLKNYLKKGLNTIEMKVQVAGCGEGYMKFRVKASYKDKIVPTCPSGYGISGNLCVKTYTYYDYLCKNDPNAQGNNWEISDGGGDCGGNGISDGESCNSETPPTNNCKREKFLCKQNEDRPCAFVDNEWQCSPFPCFGGNDIENTDTQVGLTDANNEGWDDSGSCDGQIYIFNGKDNRCRSDDVFFGLAGGGCCDKDKVFLGLVACKEEEIKLAKLNKGDKCYEVGEYCSKKIKFIGCIQKKKTFCCFNSKLARIINEQGRPQIGKEWGSSKEPDCKGFTPEEFSKLDFSEINMDEFFEDIQKKFNTNLINNQQNFIQNRITNNLNNMSGN